MTVRQIKAQERYIELGTRARVGRWLHDRVKPDDVVFLEPVGYIGYFSGARIHDWPGLVSPEVVRLRKQGVPFAKMVGALKPDWAILRLHEAVDNIQNDKYLRDNYFPVKMFDSRPQLDKLPEFPGEGYLRLDSAFLVFRKKDRPDQKEPPAEFEDDVIECNHYLYPMMKTPFAGTYSTADIGPNDCNGKPVLFAHPDAEVTYRVSASATRVSGQFGILPRAYEEGNTDGVDFVIEHVPPAGTTKVLFERELNPRGRLADRGMQRFDVALPAACQGILRLKTRNLPGKNPAWDFAYWTDVEIHCSEAAPTLVAAH
jgi:hypothetical protein